MRPVVLCIGGLDPSGCAGLLADVRAVELLGGRPLGVVTAHTFQTSRRAEGFEPVPVDVVMRQVRLLLDDEPVGAVKVGQLPDAALAAALAAELEKRPALPVVLDTPLATSSGSPLMRADSVRAAYAPLLQRAAVVTPNREEVRVLIDRSTDDAVATVRSLGASVLLKGGHAEGEEAEDLLILSSGPAQAFATPRLPGHFRGTGCRLASAIAFHLAAGFELAESVALAKHWLHEELRLESQAREAESTG